MIIHLQKLNFLVIIFFGSIFISCENKSNVPSNNDFSYINEKQTTSQGAVIAENQSITTESNNTKIFLCDDFNTELSGRLEEYIIFGPPGFGKSPEKDKQITGYKLILHQPIKVSCSDGENSETITSIQLQIESLQEGAQVIGSNVVVRGQIFAAHSPYHTFPYVIAVKRMQSVNSSSAL